MCVDDVGLHAGVNEAALRLVALGRVHALGVLVGAPAWPAAVPALRALDPAAVDVGLHLDLTEFPLQPGWRQPLWRLIARAYGGRLQRSALRAEIRRQLDAFEAALGRGPDFVDGHRHVHQLPLVRDELVAELAARQAPDRRAWLRSTRRGDGRWFELKPRLVEWLGARALSVLARGQGFGQNRRLLGVYGFDGGEAGYRRRLAGWLDGAGDADLLMCHPATGGDDALQAARRAEYAVWAAPDLPGALAARGLVLAPMSRVLAGQRAVR
ncbi:MAG: ChbG/HpnK family deacetylase [Rubrivivax sp.]|nr:ChbG/HpnK family deacetylase [Rubrivivax sp.]